MNQNISNVNVSLKQSHYNAVLPKSDEEFLDDFCKFSNVVFNNGDNEVIFIKDKDLNIYYLSPGYLEALSSNGAIVPGGAKPEEAEERKQIIDEMTATLHKHDQKVRDSAKPKSFLLIDVYQNITITRKRPIINPATGNFIGIIGTVRPYTLPNILQLIYRVNGVEHGMMNKVQDKSTSYDLTERQHMVLFFYLNKYSNTEIADILTTLGYKISKTRVNDHLENLKYIFQVKTKEQLIEKAISHNYHIYFPRKLLKVGIYEIDDFVTISP